MKLHESLETIQFDMIELLLKKGSTVVFHIPDGLTPWSTYISGKIVRMEPCEPDPSIKYIKPGKQYVFIYRRSKYPDELNKSTRGAFSIGESMITIFASEVEEAKIAKKEDGSWFVKMHR